MFLAMEDTVQRQVGERSSIHILLPFKNGNTIIKLCQK